MSLKQIQPDVANMQISVLLDRSRPESLTTQMVDQFRDAIRCARIAPGTRLPSSRRLSEQLRISRNTAVRAYELLRSKASSSRGQPPASLWPTSSPDARYRSIAPPALFDRRPPRRDAAPLRQGRCKAARSRPVIVSVRLLSGRPSAELFPLKTWRRLLHATLSHGGAAGLTQYADPAGPVRSPRSAIANLLAASRALSSIPRDRIVSGVQEGWHRGAFVPVPGETAMSRIPAIGAPSWRSSVGGRLARVAVDRSA